MGDPACQRANHLLLFRLIQLRIRRSLLRNVAKNERENALPDIAANRNRDLQRHRAARRIQFHRAQSPKIFLSVAGGFEGVQVQIAEHS